MQFSRLMLPRALLFILSSIAVIPNVYGSDSCAALFGAKETMDARAEASLEKFKSLGFSDAIARRMGSNPRVLKKVIGQSGNRALTVYRGLHIPPERLLTKASRPGEKRIDYAIYVGLDKQTALHYANSPERTDQATILELEIPEFFFHSSYQGAMSLKELQLADVKEWGSVIKQGYDNPRDMPDLKVFLKRVGLVKTSHVKPRVTWLSYDEALKRGYLAE